MNVVVVFRDHRPGTRPDGSRLGVRTRIVLAGAAAEGGLHIRAHDCCPFELFVFDRTVGVTAHDGTGVSHAFVETEGEAAVEWANGLFDRYAAEAEYVTRF